MTRRKEGRVVMLWQFVMQIPHLYDSERSGFFLTLRPFFAKLPGLQSGEPVSFNLGADGGYSGEVVVVIDELDFFETTWNGSDLTRFPARVRAAATALRDGQNFGTFRITHRDGVLSIQFLRSVDSAGDVLSQGTSLAKALWSLEIGRLYDRHEIAEILGYKTFNAIAKGIVTPANQNKIILFVTEEKEEGLREYENSLRDGILSMDAARDHRADDRLVNSSTSGEEIHLFHRNEHRAKFSYEGTVTLLHHTLYTDRPSHFKFTVDHHLAALATEDTAHGVATLEDFGGDEEGFKQYRLSIQYERSPRNRAAAIRIHGTKCKACDFDFNIFYGAEHAREYIELHHVSSIASGVRQIDPVKDLVPLCSNCHSMVHRKRDVIVSVQDLKALIAVNRQRI